MTIRDDLPLILHVHTLPWVGGSGLNTFLSMKLLDRARFRTALACQPGGRLQELVLENGFPFIPLKQMQAEVSPVHDLLAVRELVSVIRTARPAIVHTHNSKAGFLGRLAARLAGSTRVVHTVHGFAFHERETPARRALFRNLERLAFRWADAHVAISETLATWAEREGIGRRGDYAVIWSGIEIERFRDADRAAGRRLLGLRDDQFAVGLVSKLWEGKGHAFLIEALRPLLSDRVKLVFIGEGPLEDDLRDLAARPGADGPSCSPHVLFAGYHADVAAVTAALDAAALPSEFEGMGRVLLEAQAAGVPVLANRIGGMVDVVGPGGRLLPAGDAAAWLAAIRELIDNKAERDRRGAACREFVGTRFSAQTMVRELESLYGSLLNSSPGSGR